MTWHTVTPDDPEWDLSDVEVDEELLKIAAEIAAGPRHQLGDDPNLPRFPPKPKDGEAFAVFIPRKASTD